MKKFTKVSMIVAGILAAVGVICCIVSLVMGVSIKETAAAASRMGMNIGFNDGFSFTLGNKITLDQSLDEPIELKDNMSLSIDVGGAELEVKESDNGKFFVESEGINMAWNIEEDEIIVQTGEQKIFGNTNSEKMIIYVPKDYEFKEVEIDCGAGAIDVDSLTSKNFDLEIGAGEVVVKDIDVKDMDVECGAGSIEISGSVSGNGNIECSMGEIDLNLEQEEDYYNYNIDCSMGAIYINDSSYEGMAVERSVDNGSSYDMDIECSMGAIQLNTK